MQQSMTGNGIKAGMHIKICGITNHSEIELLDNLGVNFAGLWFGTKQGRSNLEMHEIPELCDLPRKRLQPVLVTVDIDPTELAVLFSNDSIYALQLHGFQLPKKIALIRRILPSSVKLIKALHICDGHCIEEPFIQQYLESGVDYFVMDNFISKEKIGSTGVKLPTSYVIEFFKRNNIADRTMIAGGIDRYSIAELSAIPGLFGYDIDSSVKANNRIDMARLHDIVTYFHHASRHAVLNSESNIGIIE
jgi:phosphoribosylanthranilate isomerase